MIPNLQLIDSADTCPSRTSTPAQGPRPIKLIFGCNNMSAIPDFAVQVTRPLKIALLRMDRWEAQAPVQSLRGSIHLFGGGRGLCLEDDRFVTCQHTRIPLGRHLFVLTLGQVHFRKAFVEAGRAALPFYFGRVNIVLISSAGAAQD